MRDDAMATTARTPRGAVFPAEADRGERVRLTLCAGASAVALMVVGAPGVAEASCTGAGQSIGGAVAGPILGTNGAIDVLSGGSIAGAPTGVLASSCSISTLTNSGAVGGAAGVAGAVGGAGGVGVLIDAGQMVGAIINNTGEPTSTGGITGGAGAVSTSVGLGVGGGGRVELRLARRSDEPDSG